MELRHEAEHLIDCNYNDITLQDLCNFSWMNSIKLAVDHWIEENTPIVRSWCSNAAKKYRIVDYYDDLVQDSFLESYRYAVKYDPLKGEFDHYLTAYIRWYPSRHDVIARYKRRDRGIGGPLDVCSKAFEEYVDKVSANERTSGADTMIGQLDDNDQMFLRLHYLHAMTKSEIGRRLNMPEANVRERIQRALGKLVIKGV